MAKRRKKKAQEKPFSPALIALFLIVIVGAAGRPSQRMEVRKHTTIFIVAFSKLLAHPQSLGMPALQQYEVSI